MSHVSNSPGCPSGAEPNFIPENALGVTPSGISIFERKWVAGLVPYLWAVSLLGVVWGIRLWMVSRFGSDIPNWDQWDGEGLAVYLPFYQHQLRFVDLFTPHNEHRIFFTKITDLALLLINGQWDAQLECATNALLWGLLAVITYVGAKRLVIRALQPLLFLACAATFGLPVAWQNILGGFHSQQCFLLGFSVAAIWFSVLPKSGSAAWWLGCVLALLANFTMGSGLLAAAAIAGLGLVRFVGKRASWQATWPTLVMAASAIGVGILLRVPVPDNFKAQSLRDFTLTVCHCLQWPNRGFASPLPNENGFWLAAVVYAPFLILAWRWCLAAGKTNRGDDVLLCLGLWTVLQAAAVGYARGAGAPWPASRYLDTVMFGLLVNGTISMRLFERPGGWLDWRRLILPVFSLIWMGIVLQGLFPHLTTVVGQEMPDQGHWLKAGERNVHAYLATGESKYLDSHDVPYPSGEALRARLDPPEITKILPQSVRRAQLVPFPHSPTAPRDTILFSSEFTPAYNGYVRLLFKSPEDAALVHILDAQSKSEVVTVAPTIVKTNGGFFAYFRAPRRPVFFSCPLGLVSDLTDVLQPVDVGRLSFYSMMITQRGLSIAIVSATLAFLLSTLSVIDGCYRRTKD